MVRRRTMLALAAGAAGAAVAGVSAAAAAGRRGGPQAGLTALGAPSPSVPVAPPDPTVSPGPLIAQRQVGGGSLRVDQTAFVLSHLGVAWAGHSAQIRTYRGGWSGWQELDGCNAGRDGRPAGHSALLVVPGATAYEVRVADQGTARITELNTVDSGPSADAASVASGMPMPDGTTCDVPYLSRAAWGADESYRFRNGIEYWPPLHYPVQTLTVHHGAFGNDDPNPAATVRAVYYNQAINNDWGDIGYHLLIDEAGQVYQGRWSGGLLPVFQRPVGPGFTPLAVEGAHVLSFNPANIGVCLLGDFTARTPTSAARQSLVRVLASLASVTGRNPLGTTTYLNVNNGMSRFVNVISGHRDYAATSCPGNAFYPQLGAVRQSVASLVTPPAEPSIAPRKPDEPVVSPTSSPPPRRR